MTVADIAADPAPFLAQFDNSYAALPARFFARQAPTKVAAPALVIFNEALAAELGVEAPDDPAAIFSGNAVPQGAAPLSMAYAGHQFGGFSPQLGDGRAILLGEVIDRDGRRRDIQLKGAGRSAFSRGGDGRAALGPVLREYLVSEAMHALGIPTTRALAAVMTGEKVVRERALPGAVLTRILASNVRVGTFQYFAARGDLEGVGRLADYVIERHFPALAQAPNPYLALLQEVVARQAALIARWQQIGFIHGVMNTDNMAISGETIDFGPCAFMDAYDPGTVFSSIDEYGRYAYANQPRIAQWNLTRLAETLLPLLDGDSERAVELATGAIKNFASLFDESWLDGMRRKIGLGTAEDADLALVQAFLDLMQSNGADFTLSFRALAEAIEAAPTPRLIALYPDSAALEVWLAAWRDRLAREPADVRARAAAMRRVNPAFIPRNQLVEAALSAAIEHVDFAPFHALLAVLQHPYDDQPNRAAYAEAPAPSPIPYRTFCGT